MGFYFRIKQRSCEKHKNLHHTKLCRYERFATQLQVSGAGTAAALATRSLSDVA